MLRIFNALVQHMASSLFLAGPSSRHFSTSFPHPPISSYCYGYCYYYYGSSSPSWHQLVCQHTIAGIAVHSRLVLSKQRLVQVWYRNFEPWKLSNKLQLLNRIFSLPSFLVSTFDPVRKKKFLELLKNQLGLEVT